MRLRYHPQLGHRSYNSAMHHKQIQQHNALLKGLVLYARLHTGPWAWAPALRARGQPYT